MTHKAQKTDLREKVAAIIFDREYPDAWQEARKRSPDVEDYLKDADAVLLIARPAIIEECAKVAKSHFTGIFTGWKGYPSDSWITLDEAEDAANECGPICAAAIRALAKKP